MSAPALLLGATQSLDTELIEILGAAAAVLATIGLLLLLPIYLTHRREVTRLLEWMEHEPEAGTTEFRAITPPPVRPDGKMTPAERVTSERPALTRISTGEYAAIEPEPVGFWKRVIDRGPRHPLVLAIVAILIGVAAFVVGSQLIRSDEDGQGPGPIDPSTVRVAVVNATGEGGVGDTVSNRLERKGFVVTSNSIVSDPAKRSAVYYARGSKREGKAVAKALNLGDPKVFEAEQEAAADGAAVVVVAGEDGRAAPSGDGKDESNDAANENAGGEPPAGEG